MRLRWQRRLRKQPRRMSGHERSLAVTAAKMERQGLPLVKTLLTIMLDPTQSHFHRAAIGKLLSVGEDGQAVKALLKLFFEQTGKNDLYTTALTLEELDDRRAVPPLIRALLEDNNPHRRHAAARALGWIRHPGRAAALALARCLEDDTQPQPAREEAAESLAYVGRRETIGPLISVLHDPDVRIRFWAAFGLGKSCRGDARAVKALESILDDDEVPPGNWWSVGKEALAMLGSMDPPVADYRARLERETQHVFSNVDATVEDRRWAEGYTTDPPPTRLWKTSLALYPRATRAVTDESE
jgi:HEAT repeat protein